MTLRTPLPTAVSPQECRSMPPRTIASGLPLTLYAVQGSFNQVKMGFFSSKK